MERVHTGKPGYIHIKAARTGTAGMYLWMALSRYMEAYKYLSIPTTGLSGTLSYCLISGTPYNLPIKDYLPKPTYT